MKKLTALVALGSLMILMVSCADNKTYMPLTTTSMKPITETDLSTTGSTGSFGPPTGLEETGGPIVDDETITTIAGYTADASTFKEHEVHETLRNRDIQIAKAAKYAGVKSSVTMVQEVIEIQVAGQPTTVIKMSRAMPTFSWTPEAEFRQPLPEKPSEHPGWKTATSLVKWTGGTILGVVGINAINDMWASGLAAAGSSFVGDGYDFNQSFNETSRSNGVSFGGSDSDICQGEGCFAPTPEAEVEECWVPDDPTCSCESRAAGRC